jgi:hypothetical protein
MKTSDLNRSFHLATAEAVTKLDAATAEAVAVACL